MQVTPLAWDHRREHMDGLYRSDLAYKDDPRTERIKTFIIAVDP